MTHAEIETRIATVLRKPDPEMLASVRSRHWTGHNIPLTETDSTLGSEQGLIGADPRTVTIKRLLHRFLPPSTRQARILDLGSLEGGLSFELAREGWEVTGIEGRESNYEKAELIRRYFGLDNLRFEMRDVKTLNATSDGRFDAVVCCGLLYHLDEPFAFLRTLREITAEDGLLFVDTHVAPPDLSGERLYAGQLSDLVTVMDGGREYDGRWFSEPSGGSVLDQQWSAVSNARSFWPSRRSLIRGVYHAGFPSIIELYGMFDIDGEFALRDHFSRLWLAATRSL